MHLNTVFFSFETASHALPCLFLIECDSHYDHRNDCHSEGVMTKKMTYKELSEFLDIKLPSARRLVMRKKWLKIKGNDGEARVMVPDEFLEGRYDGEHDDNHNAKSDNTNDELITLKIENAALKAQFEAEKVRADTAEKDRDRWHDLANKPWFKRLF